MSLWSYQLVLCVLHLNCSHVAIWHNLVLVWMCDNWLLNNIDSSVISSTRAPYKYSATTTSLLLLLLLHSSCISFCWIWTCGVQEFAFKLAVKVRVSDVRDNTPRRDHVIAVCNQFDLIFVGAGNGSGSSFIFSVMWSDRTVYRYML